MYLLFLNVISFLKLISEAFHNAWELCWVGATGKISVLQACAHHRILLRDIGRSTGSTISNATGWRDETSSGRIYADVDTSLSKFEDQPYYFTELYGHNFHWRAEGVHIQYLPSRTGFRTYLTHKTCFQKSCKEEGDISAEMAEHFGWTISWIGVEKKRTPKDLRDSNFLTGVSETNWKSISNPYEQGIYVDVDINTKNFRKTPALVMSVSSDSYLSTSTGAANLFSLTRNSFRVYLSDANARRASNDKWTVHYLGYDGDWPVDCKLSAWSAWSACSHTCNGGVQIRKRGVIVEPVKPGKSCGKTKQASICNAQECGTRVV